MSPPVPSTAAQELAPATEALITEAVVEPGATAGGPTAPPPFAEVALLTALTALHFMANALVTPTLDALVRQPFGLSNAESGRFVMMPALAHLVFGLAAGLWSDRTGRRMPMLVLGLVGSGACFASLPFIENWHALLALRFVEGMFGTMAVTLLFTRAVDISSVSNRGRVLAAVSMALPIGYISGQLLALQFGEANLGALFATSGALIAAGGVVVAAFMREPAASGRRSPGVGEMVSLLRRSPRLLVPIAFGMVDKYTFGALAVLTGLAARDLHGVGAIEGAGVAMLAFWVAFLAGCLPSGSIIDRFGPFPPLVAGSLVYGIAMAALGEVSLDLFVALMAVCGLASAVMYIPGVALVGRMAPPEARATAMGAFNTAGIVGLVAGIIISSRLSESSYAAAYRLAGGLEVACAAAGLILLLFSRFRAGFLPGFGRGGMTPKEQ